MKPAVLILLCLAGYTSSVLALDASKLEAARQKFEGAGGTEAARQTYVTTLAAMLGREQAKYLDSSKRDEAAGQAIDKLNAALKALPAPEDANSKRFSKLRVGKWQSPRHMYLCRADGTEQMESDDQGPASRWSIKAGKYFTDGMTYTILCLDDRSFVFTDGESVFYERRLSK